MRIALVGDVALFGKYSLAENPGAWSCFSEVSEYLSGFDHVVCNLETPFVVDARVAGAKSAYVKSHPANVELLRRLHVDVVNLANNHIYDFGEQGYRQTVDCLQSAGIRHFGTDGKSLVLEDQGGSVRLAGFCSHDTNPLGAGTASRPGVVNAMSVRGMEDVIREAESCGQLPIVSVHTGFEHVNYPDPVDMRVARHLASIAPYVYYGHHPHVIQGAESVSGSLIAYSLGNFCFDDVYTSASKDVPLIAQTDNNRDGLILELEIGGAKLLSSAFTPVVQRADRLVVGSDQVRRSLEAYSEALALPAPEYQAMRTGLVQAYIQSRRALRDVNWVLKRLRPRYASLLVHARLNRLRHRKHVIDQLP